MTTTFKGTRPNPYLVHKISTGKYRIYYTPKIIGKIVKWISFSDIIYKSDRLAKTEVIRFHSAMRNAENCLRGL
jgi:hypothetical protein